MLRSRPDSDELRLSNPGVTAGSTAFAALDTEAAWKAFHARLHAYVARRVGARADADDIVQKVFLRMHQSLPALRHADRIGAWLFRIARNAIIDHYRSPARRREVPAGDARSLEAVGGRVESESDNSPPPREQASRCLRPMIERLPESYRRAIDLVELQEMTQSSAAAREGLSLSGMKTRVQRGRRLLKETLLGCCPSEAGVGPCGGREIQGREC